MENINTRSYWERRFETGDWERNGGYSQTRHFAEAQVPFLDIPKFFSGSICDFGCGAGDAIPVYRSQFPNAKLIGIDFSTSAIDLCREKYGNMAEFICGDHMVVPKSDVIISSNVFEHLDNGKEIAQVLKERCTNMYIVVPYKETIVPGSEHINSYDLDSFNYLGPVETKVFLSEGWSLQGWNCFYHIHLKNILRPFIGKPLLKQGKQVMYIIRNR